MTRYLIYMVTSALFLAAPFPCVEFANAQNRDQRVINAAPRATGVIRTFSQTHIVLANGKVFKVTPVTRIMDLEENDLTRQQTLIPCEVEITYHRVNKKEPPYATRVIVKKILEGAQPPGEEAPR